MWPYLIVFAGFCFFLFWFCCTRKQDVIETHETNARIIGILIVSGLLSVWLLIYGLASLAEYISSGWGICTLVLVVPFMLPMILVSYSYLNSERSFRRRYDLKARCFANALGTEWPLLVEKLSEKLGLSNFPKVAIMDNVPQTPIIFGKSRNRTILALPSRFRELMESTSGQKSHIVEGVIEFVLLHELAHIKNGDVVFSSWLECFFRPFRYLVGLLIFCLFIDSLLLKGFYGIGVTFVLLIVSYGVLTLLAKSFVRYRELLADARAGLSMDKRLLSELLEAKDDGDISPFESAVLMCTVRSAFGAAKASKERLSGTVVSRLAHIIRALQSRIKLAVCVTSKGTIQEVKIRTAALKSQRYVSTQSALPTLNIAFWNGLVGGLALLLSLSIAITLEQNGESSWALWRFGKTANVVFLCAAYSMWFYVSYVYSLPLRNSITTSMEMGSYLKSLAWRYCIGALAGTLLFTILTIASSTTWNEPFMYIKAVTLSGTFYVMAFLLSCIFSILLYLGEFFFSALYRQKEMKLLGLVFMPALLFVLGGFAFLAWWVDWFATVLCISIVGPASLLLSRIFRLDGNPIDRWLRFSSPVCRKLFVRCVFEKCDFGIVNLYLFVMGLVPSSLMVFVLAEFLGTSVVLGLGLSKRQILYPAGLIACVSLSFAFYFGKKHIISQSLTRTLRIGYLLTKCLEIMGCKLFTDDSKNMQQLLSLAEDKEGGFSTVKGKRLVEMDSTWMGVSTFSTLGLKPPYSTKHVEWILQCENKQGGFSVLPTLSSRLSATFYAISSLSKLDSLHAVNLQIHTTWIKKWQIGEGGFHGPYSRWELLTDTYFAVGALKLLGQADLIDRKLCALWALNNWRKGSPVHERTYYLINILVWLGQLSQERAEEIERKYLLPYAPVMAHLRIDKYPGPVFYYLSCTATLGDIATIERKTGQFTNSVQMALGSFIRNSTEKLITDGLRRDTIFVSSKNTCGTAKNEL